MSDGLPLTRTYLIRVELGSARYDSTKLGDMFTLVRLCRSTRSTDSIRHNVDADLENLDIIFFHIRFRAHNQIILRSLDSEVKIQVLVHIRR